MFEDETFFTPRYELRIYRYEPPPGTIISRIFFQRDGKWWNVTLLYWEIVYLTDQITGESNFSQPPSLICNLFYFWLFAMHKMASFFSAFKFQFESLLYKRRRQAIKSRHIKGTNTTVSCFWEWLCSYFVLLFELSINKLMLKALQLCRDYLHNFLIFRFWSSVTYMY